MAEVEDSAAESTAPREDPKAEAVSQSKGKAKAEIPAGLSYVNSYGTLQKVLLKVIDAPAPDRITQDFLGNVWGFTGSSGMAAIPLLKKIDFLSSDGVPTDHYRQFRTETARNPAVRHALRKGFPDIYKQTDFAENAKDEKVADIVVGLTGRSKTDGTVRAILETFKTIKGFMNSAEDVSGENLQAHEPQKEAPPSPPREHSPYNLSYQINIVLPETKEVEVFDAIFRKLKEHLL